jgi:hypothetical protein
MVRRIRSALKALEIAILKDVKLLLETAAASRANDRFGHTPEVQGLHGLTAAFGDEADRWTVFFMLG